MVASRRAADPLRLVTAVVLTVGLVLGALHAKDPIGLPWFFTIQVNTAQLILTLAGDGRRWSMLRTAVLVYVLVAGLAFVLVLANPNSPYSMSGIAAARGRSSDISNLLLHVVAPVLVLAGWLRDRPLLPDRRRFLLVLPVYPLLYLSGLLLRGATWDERPGRYLYPFMDVPAHGYPTVLRNSLILAVTIMALGGSLAGLARVSRLDPLTRPPVEHRRQRVEHR